jgi:hypothetical protein
MPIFFQKGKHISCACLVCMDNVDTVISYLLKMIGDVSSFYIFANNLLLYFKLLP